MLMKALEMFLQPVFFRAKQAPSFPQIVVSVDICVGSYWVISLPGGGVGGGYWLENVKNREKVVMGVEKAVFGFTDDEG